MAFGFPAYHTEVIQDSGLAVDSREQIKRAIERLGWTIQQESRKVITASTKIDFSSRGERVVIQFLDGGRVTVTSRCAHPTQCFDWGKNRANVGNLIAAINGREEARPVIESRRWLFPFIGFMVGLLATFQTAFLAMMSGGAGHGDYGLARFFYPYTMLLWLQSGGPFSTTLIILSLAQFPLYGLAIGMCGKSAKAVWGAVLIFLAHAVAVVFCFSGVIPGFS